jgi:hypothetical protein
MENQSPTASFCKRWKARREFRVLPEHRFDPAYFAVDVVNERAAKAFVEAEHYSGSYPAARIALGLFRKAPESPIELKGVAVISVPMNERAVEKHLGVHPREGAELGRFVLHDDVGFNGETWFLSRAFKLLKTEKPDLRGLISYADPVERRASDGTLTKNQHWGTIYKAASAHHVGIGTPRTLTLAPNGTVVSERSISKIRNGERGHVYAEAMLVAQGAEPRAFGEDPALWVKRALASPAFRRMRHPGNLVYAFSFDRSLKLRSLPYPKKPVEQAHAA